MIKFEFNFITQGEGIVQIDEPIGFDSAEFVLSRDEKREGRDTSFGGEQTSFSLSKRMNHRFDLIYNYFILYGWQAKVELIISTESESIKYDVDFNQMTTNQIGIISFKAVQSSTQLVLKRRIDTKVDLFSDKDIENNPIIPCKSYKVLVKAKPIVQKSTWKTGAPANSQTFIVKSASDGSLSPAGNRYIGINASNASLEYGVNSSLSFLSTVTGLNTPGGYPNLESFSYISAEENLRSITIRLHDIDIKTYMQKTGFTDPGAPGRILNASGYARLVVRRGYDLPTSQLSVLYTKNYDNSQTITQPFPFPSEIVFNIANLNRNERIWIYTETLVNATFDSGIPTVATGYFIFVAHKEMKVDITATSVAYNTVTDAVRLGDVIDYTVKSISKMEVEAPDYDPSGALYNQFLVTGNLLRGLKEKGFKTSFQDVTKGLVETYSDYQIQTNDTVYIGKYARFYENIECAVIEAVQFEDYELSLNPKYAINKYVNKFRSFQSEKEKDTENTVDIVHGSSEWSLISDSVENTKEVEVQWIRDPFSIEDVRRKAYLATASTETQDDDNVYALDCRSLGANERTYTETSYLQHQVLDNTLTLTNDGTFNWTLLGIGIGSSFIINSTANAWGYVVLEINTRAIKLQRAPGGVSTNLIDNTSFTYNISAETTYVIVTDQGFDAISGISNPSEYGNLNFTVKRNTYNYYNQYLATANLFSKNNIIKNTDYKNNPTASTSENGVTIVEGMDFIPTNPILSPWVHKCIFKMKMNDYIALEKNIRDKRGFIRFIDNEKNVLRGYPYKMKQTNFIDGNGELEVYLEEKYSLGTLSIFSDNLTGIITINDNISTDYNNWNIDEMDRLHVFDEVGRLLHTPVIFSRVLVNGASPQNRHQLAQWLTNI